MRTIAALVTAVCALAATPAFASAANVVIGFDTPPAKTGASANTIYEVSPGIVFGRVPSPGPTDVGKLSCSTFVSAAPATSSPPNVALLSCGGPAEFPNPPVLYGTFTGPTRTTVSLRVGNAGSGSHTMRLSGYDDAGRLIDRSPTVTIPAGGTVLTVSGGQPELATFVLDETGSSTAFGVWIDDVTFDVPAVSGKPTFQLLPTGSAGPAYVAQGGTAQTIDLSMYRVNGSNGEIDYAASGLPPGVTAKFVPSVNGIGVQLQAGPEATATSGADAAFTVTATPRNAGAGTVAKTVALSVRVTPAVFMSTRGIDELRLPSCKPITVDYAVAAHAGPARWTFTGLPPGVTALIDGVPATGADVTGSGSMQLSFRLDNQLAAPTAIGLALVGRAHFSGSYRDDQSLRISSRTSGLDVSPRRVATPRELRPGTLVTITGEDLCATAATRVRFGNDMALAPAQYASDSAVTAVVPRLATSGPVSIVPDAAHPTARIDGPPVTVDNYRNSVGFAFRNYTPSFTVDQMTAAFGYTATHYSPNICGAFTFGIVNCKIGTPLPDPWALIVLGIANATMGGSDGGACFGISRTSQQLRRGTRPYTGFGHDAARSAFDLDFHLGAAGGLQEAINSNQLTQLSSEYLAYYLTQAIGNGAAQTAGSLRGEIEGYLRRGDHPVLSLREGGTEGLANLHAVVAYDVETDPDDPAAYYIYVYDSNMPFSFPRKPEERVADEQAPDGIAHADALRKSRIHVKGNGVWRLGSTPSLGASSLGNIVVGGYDMPPAKPTLVTAGGLLKQGLAIVLGSEIGGFLRAGTPAATRPPVTATQISAGGRKLFSAPGVLNTDTRTALRATPWMPAVTGASQGSGFILGAGADAAYELEMRGERAGSMTQTMLGSNVVARVTTRARAGVVDKLKLAPGDSQVGFTPGRGSAPLDVQMMVRTRDGSSRSIEVQTTVPAGGNDSVAFDASRNAVRLTHRGAPATVSLTLSSSPVHGLPEAVTTRVRVGRNATTTLRPSSWARLGDSTLTLRSQGQTRRVRPRELRRRGARVVRLTIARRSAKRIARASIRVPSAVSSGTATVNFVLRRGKRLIAKHAVSLKQPGTRAATWTLPARARRGDRVSAVATTLLPSGMIFGSSVSQRQAPVR